MSEKEKKVLNLPMRKKYALEILRGEKVREYRVTTDHWCKIIATYDDARLLTGIKHFDVVHFYPYNNAWYLDCKIKAIIIAEIDDDFIAEFGNEYDGKKGDGVFIIRLDGVISTNLET